MEIEKIEKTGESVKSFLPALLWISLDRDIALAPTIPHFKGLEMRNLQCELRICQKQHTKVTMIMSMECQFFWIRV